EGVGLRIVDDVELDGGGVETGRLGERILIGAQDAFGLGVAKDLDAAGGLALGPAKARQQERGHRGGFQPPRRGPKVAKRQGLKSPLPARPTLPQMCGETRGIGPLASIKPKPLRKGRRPSALTREG